MSGHLPLHVRALVCAGLALVLLAGGGTSSAAAQTQCGIADTIQYPIDTTTFQLVQDYGIASPRHQGRYHTGEDWSIGGAGLGQPVRAAAAGRVTYSAPTGWGRDGGVIILEHTFPDGSVYYTHYGHLQQTDAVVFPPRLSCVEAGEIIAVIGDARPAPHLHFEVRVSQPDNPGPGYTRQNPETLGFRRPAQVIANQQAALHPAHRWSTRVETFGPAADPLVLDDFSMLVLDGAVLRGIGANGGVAWRVPVDAAAVALTGYERRPYVVTADGGHVRVDYAGAVEERYTVAFQPARPPLQVGETLIYPTRDGTLTALTSDRRAVLWRLDGIPLAVQAFAAPPLIGLETAEQRMLVISTDGQRVAEATLRDGVSFGAAPDGGLLAYTHGGLWRIDDAGTWTEALPGVPPGGGAGAVLALPDGRVFLVNHTGDMLTAYESGGQIAWEARLPQVVSGRVRLALLDGAVFLISTHGQIVVADVAGGFCGFTRVYGDDRARAWFELGADDTLRIAVGDLLVGFHWPTLAGNCAG